MGRGDGQEWEGVIGNGREKNERQYQSEKVVEAVDGGVEPRLRHNQQIRVTDYWDMLQDMKQVIQAKLSGSNGAVGQLG